MMSTQRKGGSIALIVCDDRGVKESRSCTRRRSSDLLLLRESPQLMHIKAQLEMHFVVTVDPDLGE